MGVADAVAVFLAAAEQADPRIDAVVSGSDAPPADPGDRQPARVRLLRDGVVVFDSPREHLQQALLRLMGDPEALGTLAGSAAAPLAVLPREEEPAQRVAAVLAVLTEAWASIGDGDTGDGAHGPAGRLGSTRAEASALSGMSIRTVGAFGHGVLWDDLADTPAPVQVEVYDERYFEGGQHGLGYGDYSAQPWRAAKAHRQARQARTLLEFHGIPAAGLRVLDIGCGYGDFLRCCVQDNGWQAVGVDVSAHAVARAAAHPGVQAIVGGIEAAPTAAGYDLIVMNDLIEHEPSPLVLLAHVARLLTPDGCVLIRTPSLAAAEYAVFGGRYHSVKREHLHYFTPESLSALGLAAGLVPESLRTTSHLLQGWLGEPGCALLAVSGRGSDIEALLRRQ